MNIIQKWWFVLICLIVYQVLEVIELTSVDLRFRPWWRFYSFSVRWQSLGMAQCFRRFSAPHVLGQSWSTILLRTYEKIKFLSTTHSLANLATLLLNFDPHLFLGGPPRLPACSPSPTSRRSWRSCSQGFKQENCNGDLPNRNTLKI